MICPAAQYKIVKLHALVHGAAGHRDRVMVVVFSRCHMLTAKQGTRDDVAGNTLEVQQRLSALQLQLLLLTYLLSSLRTACHLQEITYILVATYILWRSLYASAAQQPHCLALPTSLGNAEAAGIAPTSHTNNRAKDCMRIN